VKKGSIVSETFTAGWKTIDSHIVSIQNINKKIIYATKHKNFKKGD